MDCFNSLVTASINGHLVCIKNLIEHRNFNWDNMVTYHAAFYGYLDILQYAQEKKFTFHPLTTACAEYGSIECLKYCLQHNHPWQYDKQYTYRSIALQRITMALLLNDPWWTSYILNLDVTKDTDSTKEFKKLKEKIHIQKELVDTLSNKFLIKDIVIYDLSKYI